MTCTDCGNEIKKPSAIRCRSCYHISRRVPPNTCIDCGKEIKRESTRCHFCRSKILNGKKVSEETRRKMSESRKEYFDKIGRKECRDRLHYDYKIWWDGVLTHDNYTCQHCGSKKKLQVHHMEDYAGNPDLRTELSNGVTLCKRCHKNFHHLLGRRSTRAQVFWFLKNVKLGKI